MSWGQRLKTRFKFFTFKEPDNDEGTPVVPMVQYRLEAMRRNPRQTLLWKVLTCNGLLVGSVGRSSTSIGINSNQQLAMSLHWMFRVNFLFLFGVMCVMFFALVIFFAGLITVAGTIDADCVRIGGEPFDSAGAAFADAFSLSWTTFSTVGYGSTAPALGYQNNSPTHCFFINFLCSLEALLGVLYSGFAEPFYLAKC
jgi:hypothetical protein